MKTFLKELEHNKRINMEKGLENRVDIDYVIERLEAIKMEVYAVLVEYTNFEDWQSNYAELRGVYASKEKALEYIYSAFLEEIEMEMDCYSFSYDENNTEQYLEDNINSALDQWGYIELRQHFGNGVADIRLEKRKVIED